MNNFVFYSPTEFVFGKATEMQVGALARKHGARKVMIVYGGGSVVRSGLLDRVKQSLREAGIEYCLMGGVQPNPVDTKVYEGIEFCRREQADMLLPVGGGSVIDTAKAIAAGVLYEGDFWDFYIGKAKVTKALKVAVVLTIPAAGSEGSGNTVITKLDGLQKLSLRVPEVLRPVFSIMNPELTCSLSRFLTSCGVIDMFSHVCERYFTPDDEIGVIDRMSEGILKTLVDLGPRVLKEPRNYSYRAEIMWIGTIAHNNTVGVGRVQDWATHEIGNELSALYDTPHGATLSIIMGSWMRYVYKNKPERFARYAQEVFGVKWEPENTIEAAYQGILRTEDFFKHMGMPVSFHDFKIPTDGTEEMLNRIAFSQEDHCIGGIMRLNREDCQKIYQMAF